MDQNNVCNFLAAYGTLRDDNDSGSPWTGPFIEGIEPAKTGRVTGYRLFFNPQLNYPFAIWTGDQNESVVVRLLSWSTREQFERKIHIADEMEGADYSRILVDVFVEDYPDPIPAYFYVTRPESIDHRCQLIPSGDWLRRNEK